MSFGVDDVINILSEFGMPAAFVRQDTDRELIAEWLDDGLTEVRLRVACDRAVKAKSDGKPIGPRYVGKVLQTVASEESKKNGKFSGFGSKDYTQGVW